MKIYMAQQGTRSLLKATLVTGVLAGTVLGFGAGVGAAAPSNPGTPDGGAVGSWTGVQGAVETEGPVALDHGLYQKGDETQGTDGAADVTSAAPTTFDITAYSTNNLNKQALTDFTYEIVDAGTPTGYWIKAEASDHFIAPAEWHYSDCNIFKGDPNTDGTQDSASPYRCEMNSSGSAPWHVTFDVKK